MDETTITLESLSGVMGALDPAAPPESRLEAEDRLLAALADLEKPDSKLWEEVLEKHYQRERGLAADNVRGHVTPRGGVRHDLAKLAAQGELHSLLGVDAETNTRIAAAVREK